VKAKETVQEWLLGHNKNPRGLWFWDDSAYSYGEQIGRITPAGVVVYRKYFSQTTTKHINLIVRAARELGIPVTEETSPV
jgi:hypothetical protein